LDRRVQVRFDESDLVQETFTRAVASQEPCQGTGTEDRIAWLERIQDRVLIDKWREHHAGIRDVKREEELRNALLDSTAHWEANLADRHQSSPSTQAQRKELFLRVTTAIQQLPDDQQDVVMAVLILHQTPQEVAESLGKTKGQVAGLYSRGIAALRLLLKDLQGGSDCTAT
jgi:RNA polymerase sigma-70 factor (subfamily 1)